MAGSNPYAEKRDSRDDRKRRRNSSGSPQPFRRRRADSRERYGDKSPGPSRDGAGGPQRQRKRPGQGARLTQSQKDHAAAAARQREADHEARVKEQMEHAQHERRGIGDAVREHYNQVPERGREWRRTESKIKGLREYNNWVKSCLIQKFSASEDATPGASVREDGQEGRHRYSGDLCVLDIGCGKGGDLFKWQRAPQRVGLYVGIDPANVSIQQARGRYEDAKRKSRGRRIFHAEFFARDGFGQWIGDIPIVQQVGVDPNVGPGVNGRWGGGGFDVVTMMFCMHYALESEEKVRGMLRNVSGALKKGGRFFGVVPSSDVIRDNIEKFHRDWDKKKKKAQLKSEVANGVEGQAGGDADPKQDDEDHEEGGNAPGSPTFVPGSPAFVPDSPPFVPDSPTADEGGEASKDGEAAEDTMEDGKVPAEKLPDKPEPQWGNSLYNVRFPQDTPKDGVFRPPFGWKYSFFLHEAVEAPEYVVPFEAFRALAEEYGLEMTYREPFLKIFDDERNDRILGPLSERMGVTDGRGGHMKMSEEEKEAAAFYLAFCFVKI